MSVKIFSGHFMQINMSATVPPATIIPPSDHVSTLVPLIPQVRLLFYLMTIYVSLSLHTFELI